MNLFIAVCWLVLCRLSEDLQTMGGDCRYLWGCL